MSAQGPLVLGLGLKGLGPGLDNNNRGFYFLSDGVLYKERPLFTGIINNFFIADIYMSIVICINIYLHFFKVFLIYGSRLNAGPVTLDDGQVTVRRRSYLRRFLSMTLVEVKLVSSLVH